jgi:hypothetical protein
VCGVWWGVQKNQYAQGCVVVAHRNNTVVPKVIASVGELNSCCLVEGPREGSDAGEGGGG